MRAADEYAGLAAARVREIAVTQRGAIQAAARLMAGAVLEDRLIYVFGAGGHTSLAAGELFFRVGGFANVYPIAAHELTAFARARTFIRLERCEGLGAALAEASGLGREDVLLVFHTIGVNATCVDAARRAGELGAKVIGVASGRWQDETPPDAPVRCLGKRNLRDFSHVWIDDRNTVDDAALRLDGLPSPVGALSGVGAFALAHMLEAETAAQCLDMGVTPPIWRNANTAEGAAWNAALMKRFGPRVPML